jgi:hypothetical protein
MYCSGCGRQLPDDSKFCNGCGNNLENKGAISDSVVSIKNDPEIVRAALEGAAAVVSAQKEKDYQTQRPTIHPPQPLLPQPPQSPQPTYFWQKSGMVSNSQKVLMVVGGFFLFLLILGALFSDSSDSPGQGTGGTEDSDGDGISNAEDECPNTPKDEDVDPDGCSESQRDSDGDGVSDADDACPDTPSGEEVYEDGCSASQTPGLPFLFSITVLMVIAFLSSRKTVVKK